MKRLTKSAILNFLKGMDAIQLSGLAALAQAEIKKRFGK